jgi:DHA1 family chloramphenicol resistance protein-like MFS transporter
VGLLAAVMVATTTFVSTPFLLPQISAEFGVSLGTAGLLSTAQVGAFALLGFAAGRWVKTSRLLLRASVVTFACANLASVVTPWFWLLVLVRVVAGAAAGLMAWTAWADAAAEARRLSDVAAAGPIAAIVGAPLFSWLTELGRDNAAFLGMAVLAVVPLLLPIRLDAVERKGKRRISPSRSNRILLLALAAMTLCGSALFIYAAAAAQDLSGLSVTAASGAYSLNAAGGFVGTRMSRRGSAASPWVAVTGVSLLAVVLLESAPVFYAAMTIWGFAFWMAVPRVLRLLAQRSFSPDERIGDAQAGMAVGRAIGPAAGAGFAASSRFTALGVLAASGIALAASAVGGVELFRRRGGDADVHPKEPMQRWRLPTPRKAT